MRTCEVCHCSIGHKRSDAKYCSQSCSNKFHNKQKSVDKIKTCIVCGGKFLNKGRSKMCSEHCRKERLKQTHNIRYHGSKDKPSHKCEICDNTFYRNGGNSKTCSEKCSKKLKERYKKENKHRWRESHRRYNKEWRINNYDKYLKHMQDYRDRNPEVEVNRELRKQLGFEPPKSLLDEAVLVRKLRIAIRKAGD